MTEIFPFYTELRIYMNFDTLEEQVNEEHDCAFNFEEANGKTLNLRLSTTNNFFQFFRLKYCSNSYS